MGTLTKIRKEGEKWIENHKREWSAVIGAATFPISLAICQVITGAVFKISASTPFGVPSMVGAGAVYTSSCLGLYLSEASKEYYNHDTQDGKKILTNFGGFLIHPKTVVFGMYSLVLFKSIGGSSSGGRFWSLCPSEIDRPGAFHQGRGGSLPATEAYATGREKAVLNEIFKVHGCHTCGKRNAASCIGDHQPPKKYALIENSRWWRKLTGIKIQFRMYPQCPSCSAIQAEAVRKGVRRLVYHFTTLRSVYLTGPLALFSYHLFSPRNEITSGRWQDYFSADK